MLPEREDLSMYQTKEHLLNVISERRIEREREQSDNSNNGRTAATGSNPIRATSVRDLVNRAITIQGSGETSTVYGTAGSTEDSEGSDDGSDFGDGSNQGTATRGNSSTYQPQRTRTTRRDSLKDAFGRYRRVFTTDTRNKSRVDESTTKERAAQIGRKLSDVEAAKLRPKLIEYLLWQTEHLDQLIIATTSGHQPVEIWSNIDKTDCEIIAEFMIVRGRQDAKAAQAVRYLSVFIDRLKLGMIILPRMYQTAMVYFARGFSIR